jgi:Na+-translocating ferredoxin:NAD+ oxidoreductase RnfA subunit
MSGMSTRTSRFWVVGIVLITFNMGYLGYGLVALKEKLTLIEAVFHGLVLLAGLALLDWEIASRLFARLTRLRGREP